MGPPLSQRADSTSVAFFKAWVEGAAPGGGIFADGAWTAAAQLIVLAAEVMACGGGGWACLREVSNRHRGF